MREKKAIIQVISLIKVDKRINLVGRLIALLVLAIRDILLAYPSSLLTDVAILHGLQSGHVNGVPLAGVHVARHQLPLHRHRAAGSISAAANLRAGRPPPSRWPSATFALPLSHRIQHRRPVLPAASDLAVVLLGRWPCAITATAHLPRPSRGCCTDEPAEPPPTGAGPPGVYQVIEEMLLALVKSDDILFTITTPYINTPMISSSAPTSTLRHTATPRYVSYINTPMILPCAPTSTLRRARYSTTRSIPSFSPKVQPRRAEQISSVRSGTCRMRTKEKVGKGRFGEVVDDVALRFEVEAPSVGLLAGWESVGEPNIVRSFSASFAIFTADALSNSRGGNSFQAFMTSTDFGSEEDGSTEVAWLILISNCWPAKSEDCSAGGAAYHDASRLCNVTGSRLVAKDVQEIVRLAIPKQN
ncbi:hypothetical protein Scep_017019 [Stephania cephalantha]|uniref:Uncharacterized protein n=1 Tax=Stephania cephalantha TaxID=152367 RepID=A0AAP0INT1_9MAGN